jgi:hypothetical protein
VRLVTVILQAITLIAAVVASRVHPWVIRAAVAFSILGVLGAALSILGTDEFGDQSGRVVTLMLLVLVPPALVYGLVTHWRDLGGVTVETMFGVLCLYLLAGMIFGTLFGAIEELSGHPFFKELSTAKAHTEQFLYFSYTTITTVGYGDLVARTNLGRSLAVMEALIGQIYLVTVVAVIVGNMRSRQSVRAGSRN